MKTYDQFIAGKVRKTLACGFEPDILNGHLFEWQKLIVARAIRLGRSAMFEECGLGKTLQQLEWARQVCKHTGKAVFILTPLAVAAQTVSEGVRFGIVAKHIREPEEFWPGAINVLNYERLHKFEHLIPECAGVVLDESSCIKSFVGKLRSRLTQLFSRTTHRLCCTATPAPNDFTELGQQAEFLGVCTTQEMLATWFINDTADTGTWRLKGHAADDFWRWVASWAVCITKPSDLGFPDGDFILPPLNIIPTWVDVDETEDTGENLFRIPETSATGVHREQRLTCSARAEKSASLMHGSDDFWMVWCSTNYEADELIKQIPEAVEVRGSDSMDSKEKALADFLSGKTKRMVSKSSIFGYGLNLQHCCNVIYFPTYSFEDWYQAIRRFWRFGQKRAVNCYMVLPKTLGHVLDTINKKMAAHEQMNELVKFSAEALKESKPHIIMETNIETKTGTNWQMSHGDCVRVAKQMPDESIDFSVFSPPFSDLFVYSADVQDMGNNQTMDEFNEQFGFLVTELFRLTKPGRLCAVHCADLMAQKWKDGRIELKNFSKVIVEAFCGDTRAIVNMLNERLSGMTMLRFDEIGWLLHTRITIWKDPVVEMQRTKALGLLHKQLLKDSAMSRVGSPEYVLVFRKPGENDSPVTHSREEYPVEQWQKDASPVWMDIDQGNVLNGREARAQRDERHICPLQLDVVNRALRLWTNPGDTIFSPFAGIGSEGYCALKMGRKFIGAELKKSYFETACSNLRKAEDEARDLFSVAAKPEALQLQP